MIDDAVFRAITIEQLVDLASVIKAVLACELLDQRSGKRITWDVVNLYHINGHLVKPLTARDRCSYVELVANKPQPPIWCRYTYTLYTKAQDCDVLQVCITFLGCTV